MCQPVSAAKEVSSMAEEQREMPVIRAVGVKKLYKQRGGHRIG